MSACVVVVGLATLDTIHVVPRHTAQDDLVLTSELAVAGGGPAATAAVTLARLGPRTHDLGGGASASGVGHAVAWRIGAE